MSTRICLRLGSFSLVLLLAFWVCLTPVSAQDLDARRSELGVRQKLIQQKMVELETKLTATAERLREMEPERAKRLIDAYQQSKERLVTQQMNAVSQLLDQDKLFDAEKKLDKVISNLEQLLKLLMAEKEPSISKQDEIEMLSRWKKEIQERIDEQVAQQTETHTVSDREQSIQDLNAQIEKINGLTERQRTVIEATKKSAGAGLRAMDPIADKQFEVRKETESMAQNPENRGQPSLKKAVAHQQRAEEDLGSGKSKDAQHQQEQAMVELAEALREMEKEKRRIESLPSDVTQQLADQQQRTRDKAMEVVEEMKKAPQPKPKSGQPPQSQQPGQSPMEQAGDSMGEASESLKDGDLEQAEEKQKQSAEQMKEAIEEIEERLNQLREETQKEKLDRLETRFREMLARQVEVSALTVDLDDKVTNLGTLKRRDQLVLVLLANEENEINQIGQQAYALLLEDGTSSVFPEIVQELCSELAKVSQRLQDGQTGRFTQFVHQEIETTIGDLLDAMTEAKNKKQGGSGGGGGGGGADGKQPLLKGSTEIKMLKRQQLRLNRKTQKIDQLRGTPDMQSLLDHEAHATADWQSKLLEMTEGIVEKNRK